MPGIVPQPNFYYKNNTIIEVSWFKPIKPAGPIDYYQIVVTRHKGPTNLQTTDDGSPPTASAFTPSLENSDYQYTTTCMYHLCL